MINRQCNKGLTLVETILATVILCASVLALGAISTRSLSQTRLNRQYEQAGRLAQRQLVMIDYMGVENFIESGMTEGDFENLEPVYHWEVTTESVSVGNLYQVKVTVSWVERNRNFDVCVETRFNGKGTVIEATE